MKPLQSGLIIGVVFSLTTFIFSMITYYICFFLFDVRLHQYFGPSYVDVNIYYNFYLYIIGILLAIFMAIYIQRTYASNRMKNALIHTSVNSVTIIVLSWMLIAFYDRTDLFRKYIFPPTMEAIYLMIGYGGNGLVYYSKIGVFLFMMQMLVIYFSNKITEKYF